MEESRERGELVASWVGRQAFDACLRDQLAAREAVIAGEGPQRLILVEHPATLTLGRRATRDDVLWTDEQLAAEQVAVCETPRGGEVTLHAPGQLVAYPVVRVGRRIREHIADLAETTIALFGELGVDDLAFRMEHPGVWRGERKLASVGLHISRGVSVQGMSINLDVAPRLFGALVSCGLPSVEMSSVAALRTTPLPPMEQLARRWAELFVARTGHRLRWTD